MAVLEEMMIRMDPMLPRDDSLVTGGAPAEPQEAETSVTSFRSVDDDRRYSGRAFVMVMVALMALIAAGLLLASRSM